MAPARLSPRPRLRALGRLASRASRQPSLGRPESWSPGAAATTPSRTMIQPALSRRKKAATVVIALRPSKLPARVQRRYAAGEVLPGDALEAGARDHGAEIRLVGKL